MEKPEIALPEEILSIVSDFAEIKSVKTVALAGSLVSKKSDVISDCDLYVYTDKEIPPALRKKIAAKYSDRMEIDNRFFEPGDEWLIKSLNLKADIMYRSPRWIEDLLERILVKCEVSTGYSTCFWHNVLNSMPLFDRTGWFGALQKRALRPYPARLRKAIVAKNLPLLNSVSGSYSAQVRSAIKRKDAISVNHRTAAFLASYFDVLFALNSMPHPGEKRLFELCSAECGKLPKNFKRDMTALFYGMDSRPENTLRVLNSLADNLSDLAGNRPAVA